MKSIRLFFARLLAALVVTNDERVGSLGHGDPISVAAKEPTRSVDVRAADEVLSEIKARLMQETWISGRGFLY